MPVKVLPTASELRLGGKDYAAFLAFVNFSISSRLGLNLGRHELTEDYRAEL